MLAILSTRILAEGTVVLRLYRPREQVNMFLEGLEHDPQFKPAIKRARCLLDNKNKKDPTVPPALYLAVLPNTIERYLSKETGRPIVRAIYHAEQ